jgi:hypothetical protein
MNNLTGYLYSLPTGYIDEKHLDSLQSLLASCWSEFIGSSNSKMDTYKLIGRLENIYWEPPKLTFTIERHGGTVQGSSRAELHEWTVDFDMKTATCSYGGYRQIKSQQKSLDVKPIAHEISELILQNEDDSRLKWNDDGSVRVLIGKILPEEGSPKQTRDARRKRFRYEVEIILLNKGWEQLRVNTYALK